MKEVRKFEFPAILLLFLETFATLRSSYLHDGLSFFDNFFAFHLISTSSFRIVHFLCCTKKMKICLKHCDIIFPPKAVKIKKTHKNHTILWNEKFYHRAKLALSGRTPKSCSKVPLSAFCWPGVLALRTFSCSPAKLTNQLKRVIFQRWFSNLNAFRNKFCSSL